MKIRHDSWYINSYEKSFSKQALIPLFNQTCLLFNSRKFFFNTIDALLRKFLIIRLENIAYSKIATYIFLSNSIEAHWPKAKLLIWGLTSPQPMPTEQRHLMLSSNQWRMAYSALPKMSIHTTNIRIFYYNPTANPVTVFPLWSGKTLEKWKFQSFCIYILGHNIISHAMFSQWTSIIVITKPFLVETICLKPGVLIGDISWYYPKAHKGPSLDLALSMPPWAGKPHLVKTDTAAIIINQVSAWQFFKVAFNLHRWFWSREP